MTGKPSATLTAAVKKVGGRSWSLSNAANASARFEDHYTLWGPQLEDTPKAPNSLPQNTKARVWPVQVEIAEPLQCQFEPSAGWEEQGLSAWDLERIKTGALIQCCA